MNRRTFLKNTGACSALSLVPGILTAGNIPSHPALRDFDRRPPEEQRRFSSPAVEEQMKNIAGEIADEDLRRLFVQCYPNTLDTTVFYEELPGGSEDTYIITGDIEAMWLRDSTAQVWPYLPLMKDDPRLQRMVRGLIRRQAACVRLDPYANAFYPDARKPSEWASDQPSPAPGVHERKWEIDSLCYVIRLAHGYYNRTGDITPFDASWAESMKLLVETLRTEQRPEGNSPYFFRRKTTAMEDAPVHNGTGRPASYTGMVYSMFRPSDDATLFPFLVPSNLFAVWSLQQLSQLSADVLKDDTFAAECTSLAGQIHDGIMKYAVHDHLDYGKIYAYETDGYGNALFMDDANVPSLLSLSYLGIVPQDDIIYQNTRRFVLSRHNPWFLKGNLAEGNGSPHTGKSHIWPMSIILRALTSHQTEEIKHCLRMLRNTHAGTFFMHEAFHRDDPANFTRKWFAWANTLFGEMIVKVYHEHPELLKTNY